MIITVKNLQQQTFTIEFDPERTVLELKKLIFSDRGAEYIVEKQKLIYAGIILADNRTISSYKVDEKKFIVVMLTRDVAGSSHNITHPTTPHSTSKKEVNDNSKLPIKDAVGEKKPPIKLDDSVTKPDMNTNKNTPVAGGETSGIVNSEAITPASTGSPVTDLSSVDLACELANATLQTRAESNLLMGEEYNRTVASMVEMGYAREEVERAMAASFNNPERAVEYLITGIPQEENLFNRNNDREPPLSLNMRPSVSDVEAEAAADPFEFLRSQPQFLQMRSLIYQNPHLLHAVLQQIGQTNPALLQLISENQDAFLNMLNQPLDNEVTDNAQRIGRSASTIRPNETLTSSQVVEDATEGQRSAAGGEAPHVTFAVEQDSVSTISTERSTQQQPESLGSIRLTPHDQEAVNRLKALGFPEALALQAYFACEKNEELAANFLISSNFDD